MGAYSITSLVDTESIQISACIICRNEADRLGKCLESISWVDEIVVMDLSSTDRSAAIAQEHGAYVVNRDPFPIVEPLRNEIAEIAHGEWILALDPDEQVSPALSDVLREMAARPDLDAIVIPRMNFDLGYPPSSPIHRYEQQLRMYRRDKVKWPEIPNTLPVVPEERKFYVPRQDELVIRHDRSRNIPEVLDRVIRYAPAQAQAMIDQGQSFSGAGMIAALAHATYKQFLLGRAWRDGVPGLLRAGILVAFKFYVWAAFWQLSGGTRTDTDDRIVRQLGLLMEPLRLILFLGRTGYLKLRRSRRR